MAREELNQLGSWDSHQSYFVYAERPVTWTIDGALLSPDATPIVLEHGWNLVPYLLETPQPADEALASIMDHLLIVDDGEGNVFVPEAGITSLDSLRDGRGYKVYIEAPDTLVYGDAPNEPLIVNTLAAAKALTDVSVGSTIEVLGYHEPGDGGGGLFEVTDDAAETDGGTAFVFDEDVSARETQLVTTDWHGEESLPHTDLIWGTFEARYGAASYDVLTEVELHGHQTSTNRQNYRLVNYKSGAFGGVNNRIRFVAQRFTGSLTIEWEISYKYATSNKRLKRMHVTDTVNVAWWGAPRADYQNPQNAWHYLAHAMNKAARLQEEGNLQWAYVDVEGEYFYRYCPENTK